MSKTRYCAAAMTLLTSTLTFGQVPVCDYFGWSFDWVGGIYSQPWFRGLSDDGETAAAEWGCGPCDRGFAGFLGTGGIGLAPEYEVSNCGTYFIGLSSNLQSYIVANCPETIWLVSDLLPAPQRIWSLSPATNSQPIGISSDGTWWAERRVLSVSPTVQINTVVHWLDGRDLVLDDILSDPSLTLGDLIASSRDGSRALFLVNGGFVVFDFNSLRGDFHPIGFVPRFFSADLLVAFGMANNVMVRWTSQTGTQPIALPADVTWAVPSGSSGDGSRLVGTARIDGHYRAFLWDLHYGFQWLECLVKNAGGTLSRDVYLQSADSISFDGNAIVGTTPQQYFVTEDVVFEGVVPYRVLLNGPLAVGPCIFNVCVADFNHDGAVDGSDVQAFFEAWEGGSVDADINEDGGVDGADIAPFFMRWQTGWCY